MRLGGTYIKIFEEAAIKLFEELPWDRHDAERPYGGVGNLPLRCASKGTLGKKKGSATKFVKFFEFFC